MIKILSAALYAKISVVCVELRIFDKILMQFVGATDSEVKCISTNAIENIGKQISWSTKQAINFAGKRNVSVYVWWWQKSNVFNYDTKISAQTNRTDRQTDRSFRVLQLNEWKWKNRAKGKNEKLDASISSRWHYRKDRCYLFLWPGVNQTELSTICVIWLTAQRVPMRVPKKKKKRKKMTLQWQQHHKRDKLTPYNHHGKSEELTTKTSLFLRSHFQFPFWIAVCNCVAELL